ncbi:Reticulocyte-binding protein 2 a [Chlorella vulgaris]
MSDESIAAHLCRGNWASPLKCAVFTAAVNHVSRITTAVPSFTFAHVMAASGLVPACSVSTLRTGGRQCADFDLPRCNPRIQQLALEWQRMLPDLGAVGHENHHLMPLAAVIAAPLPLSMKLVVLSDFCKVVPLSSRHNKREYRELQVTMQQLPPEDCGEDCPPIRVSVTKTRVPPPNGPSLLQWVDFSDWYGGALTAITHGGLLSALGPRGFLRCASRDDVIAKAIFAEVEREAPDVVEYYAKCSLAFTEPCLTQIRTRLVTYLELYPTVLEEVHQYLLQQLLWQQQLQREGMEERRQQQQLQQQQQREMEERQQQEMEEQQQVWDQQHQEMEERQQRILQQQQEMEERQQQELEERQQQEMEERRLQQEMEERRQQEMVERRQQILLEQQQMQQRLRQEMEERRRRIVQLQQEMEERRQRIVQLQQEMEERRQRILQQQQQVWDQLLQEMEEQQQQDILQQQQQEAVEQQHQKMEERQQRILQQQQQQQQQQERLLWTLQLQQQRPELVERRQRDFHVQRLQCTLQQVAQRRQRQPLDDAALSFLHGAMKEALEQVEGALPGQLQQELAVPQAVPVDPDAQLMHSFLHREAQRRQHQQLDEAALSLVQRALERALREAQQQRQAQQ